MKILIQRVESAQVTVENAIVGSIDAGLLVFIGVTHSDTVVEASYLAKKLVQLRIFEDSEGKMNRSLVDIQGQALIISQFTLYADCEKGRRPSFIDAALPAHAKLLYERFVEEVKKEAITVQTGIFGAEMKVGLVNDGPVTILLERNA
jgi:D-tyrosyl-tRNA(Tyr) deacylase